MMKEVTLELMDTIFVPRTVARQLALAVALDAGMVTMSSIMGAIQSFLSNFSSRSRLIRQLKDKQERSETQDDWIELALKIDNVQGNDVWRYVGRYSATKQQSTEHRLAACILFPNAPHLLFPPDPNRTVPCTSEKELVLEWMNLSI